MGNSGWHAPEGCLRRTLCFMRRNIGQIALLLISSLIPIPTASAAFVGWQEHFSPKPLPRGSPALAFDSARNRTVLFASNEAGGAGPVAETWEWDATAWVEVTPAVRPSARSGHALAYDSARDRIVLFGGTDAGSAYLGDTWEWDGTAWVDVTPAVSPPARSGHALAYDSARGRVVLFGGEDGTTWLGDTWEWDGTTWVDVTPAVSPPARFGHAMAYHSARGRVVLFGGEDAAVWFGDTWEWDGTAWVKLTPTVSPSSRSGHALAYDSTRGRVVLFGGNGSGGFLSETWEWSGTAWVKITSTLKPQSRIRHAMAYDGARGRMVLFGGRSASATFADTWQRIGVNWQDVSPGVAPPARSGHAMAYDSARDRVVLFGGLSAGGSLGDTWEWDGTAWKNFSPAVSPFARQGHAMVYDSARGRVVLFGGESGAPYPFYFSDTWEWNGTTWKSIAGTVPPSYRSYHALAYDSARNRVVLFGGYTGYPGSQFEDTWELNGTTWVNVTPPISPVARVRLGMAYDSARHRVVLYGGYGTRGVLGDTWEWDGTAWANVTPIIRPPDRSFHNMVYDSTRDRVIVFGGFNISGNLADTWGWDGTAWTEVTPPLSPPARGVHGMAYDSARDRVVLFGGYSDSSGSLADTWEFGELPETRCDDQDDNGDGQVDEGCDDDADGYCDPGMIAVGLPAACPHGGADCEDANAAVHPGAPELCDALDNDCDGAADEDLGTTTCGLGLCEATVDNCVGGIPGQCVPGPPAPEACNGLDDDCDGTTDEGFGPGTVEVSLDQVKLWPPNHRMVDVHATVDVDGGCPTACAAPPTIVLASVTSSEPDDSIGGADGQTIDDIQGVTVGTSDFDFSLRAERDGAGNGRLYETSYLVTDCFGDTAVGYDGIFVPHDVAGETEPLLVYVVAPLGVEARSYILEWNTIPHATGYNIIRGRISQIDPVGSFAVIDGAGCLARGLTTTSLSAGLFDEDPEPGESFFYLVEYVNGMRSGYGTEAGSSELIIRSGDSCH